MSKKDKKKEMQPYEAKKAGMAWPVSTRQNAVASIPPEEQVSINEKIYNKELARLQVELIKLQEWVRFKNLKVVVIFEGRDAAGKGGIIKRITESLNPRACRVVALPAPTEREKSQWYFQRYVSNLPAGGEMVLIRPKLV